MVTMFRTRTRTTSVLLVTLLAGAALAGCRAPRPRAATGPNADAIETASKIRLSGDRHSVLTRIARRQSLSQVEQLYLVDAICADGYGDDKANSLVALIDNPVCTVETRDYIADRLEWCALGAGARRVVEALFAHTPPEPTDASPAAQP